MLKDCEYGDNSPLPAIPGYTKRCYEVTLAQPHLLRCPDIDYHIVHTTVIQHGILELRLATVNCILKCILSTGGSIESMLTEYFRTIGSWLPMISRKRLCQSLTEISSTPRADFALLLLSIYLIVENMCAQWNRIH
jgi:hypothetical protein